MSFPGLPQGLPGLTYDQTLGRGGFGAVYRARHHTLDVDVAVKIIDASGLDAGDLDKTLREARLMARLDHPNLLRIFDAGKAGNVVYLVLELMDGGSCKGIRSLPASRAIAVAKQLLSGLQALHDARILHRDIKPANCLHRAHDDRVKLADLGIAADWVTVSAPYELAGTIPFMAPELFEQTPRFSPSSDLYALGVTLACMLLPTDPFPAGSFDALRSWVFYGERPHLSTLRPDLPQAFSGLVSRMMSPLAPDRPTDASEALAYLSTIELVPPKEEIPPTRTDDLRDFPTNITKISVDTTIQQTDRIGAWEIGEVIFSSSNWLGHVVNHIYTGKAARLVHLKEDGPISSASDSILLAAERASRLSHPNLLEVIDWGEKDGRVYVVTSMQGRSFHDLAENGRQFDEPTSIRFMAGLADALIYLHGQGLVFQLIDPGSVVMGSDARAALLSWPIFCVPAGSPPSDPDGKVQRFFIPSFAAPEILSRLDTPIEPSGDLFGLGATFFYLLAGRRAYSVARKSGNFPNLRDQSGAITAPFISLLARLTAADPSQRPTAVQLKEELVRIGARIGVAI